MSSSFTFIITLDVETPPMSIRVQAEVNILKALLFIHLLHIKSYEVRMYPSLHSYVTLSPYLLVDTCFAVFGTRSGPSHDTTEINFVVHIKHPFMLTSFTYIKHKKQYWIFVCISIFLDIPLSITLYSVIQSWSNWRETDSGACTALELALILSSCDRLFEVLGWWFTAPSLSSPAPSSV